MIEESTILAPDKAEKSPYSRRVITGTLICILLATFFNSLDQNITAPAMPRIIAEFAGFQLYTWVSISYALAATITIPIYGKLADQFAPKGLFLFCLLTFLAGSVLCGLSQSMLQLILFRALQGLGAGGIMPLAASTIGRLIPPREQGKWQGIMMAFFGVSFLLGPAIGGVITDLASWRWVFFINLPLDLLALLLLLFIMPPLAHTTPRGKIDFLGAGLLVLGTVPLLLGFTWAGDRFPWLSWQSALIFGGSLLVLSLFFTYEALLERRQGQPIIAPSMFKKPIFSISLACMTITFSGIFGTATFLPLYAQAVLHISATESGVVLSPMMLGITLVSIISGQLISKWGRYRWLAIGGMLIAIIGGALMLRLDTSSSVVDILIATSILGAGIGVGIPLYSLIVQNVFPRNIGQAIATLDFFQELSGPVILAIMGSLLTLTYPATFASALPATIKAHVPASLVQQFEDPTLLTNPTKLQALGNWFAENGHGGSTALAQLIFAAKTGLSQTMHLIFLISLFILIAGLIAVFFLPEVELRGETELSEGQSTSEN